MFGKRSGLSACSFCGKPHHEVRKLIAGPRAYICNECIEVSARILELDSGRESPEFSPGEERRELLQELYAAGSITPAVFEEQMRTLPDVRATPRVE